MTPTTIIGGAVIIWTLVYIWAASPVRWYVQYPEGYRSIGLPFFTALSYRRMFGGRVYCCERGFA